MYDKLLCLRCGHEWTPRNLNKLPKVCPNCKSTNWNRLKPFNDRGPKRLKVPGDKTGKKVKFKSAISNL